MIALFFEVYIFNFRHFESLTFQGSPNETLTLTKIDTQTLSEEYRIKENNEKLTYFISGEVNLDVSNISLNGLPVITPQPGEGRRKNNKIEILLAVRDDGNNIFSTYPTYTMDSCWKPSKYARIHTYGKLKQILLGIDSTRIDANTFDININSVVPLNFSTIRCLYTLLFVLLIIYLFPKSRLTKKLKSCKLCKFVLISSIVVIQALLIIWIASNNKLFDYTTLDSIPQHTQYGMLAESLLDGRLSLDLAVSNDQINAINPYDQRYLNINDVLTHWDRAYFNGKYYCYFGVLPVLLFYLPFLVLTGTTLNTCVVVNIMAFIIPVSLMYLLIQINNRYFPNISFRNFVILDILLFFGSCSIIQGLQPSFYSITITLGLSCLSFGLGCWIKASNLNNNYYYFIGSTFTSLTIMTRPALILGCLLVIPFALIPLFRKKEKASSIITTIFLSIIPYLVVGGFQMYYNYKRFGNPFDFGANYNITTNDMTHRGLVIDRFGPGFFEYMLQPPVLAPAFPYLKSINLSNSDIGYVGITIMEDCYGGFPWLCPVSLFTIIALFSSKIKATMKVLPQNKEIYCTLTICLIIGVSLILIDTQVAGILFRYFLDFGFFFTLGSIIVVGVLLNTNPRNTTSSISADIYAFNSLNTKNAYAETKQRQNIKTSLKNVNYVAYALTIYTTLIWSFVVMASIF